MNNLSKKQINILVIILSAIMFFMWDFVVVPSRQKGQEYNGTIVKTYKSRKWYRGRQNVMSAQYRNYTYYWQVECDDGDIIDAVVPWRQWRDGHEGLPVKKIKGQRWPQINTREALEKRDDAQRALDMVFK